MKKLFTLIAMACMAIGAQAQDNSTVGLEDNTSGWWTAFSDYYTIAPGKTLHLEFVNYSSKVENWNNWVAVVTTAAERGADGYTEYFVLRADNYGWGDRYNGGNLRSSYNWDTFKDDMDGATVKMDIKRSGAMVIVYADITTAAGATYFERFETCCGYGNQDINAFLTVDGAHLVIDNTKTTTTDTTAEDVSYVGRETNDSEWWQAFSDYYTLEPGKTLCTEFTNYSSKEGNWNNWIAVLTTEAERGADGYSEYVVLRADNYAWAGALNTGAESSHDWFTSFSSNYNWDTFKDDLDGAVIALSVVREDANVKLRAEVSGTELYEEMVLPCGDGTQNINLFLTTEKGHLAIDNTKTTIIDTSVYTGIESVKGNTGKGAAYNMAGQQVGNGYRGLIIKNGKKMLVK